MSDQYVRVTTHHGVISGDQVEENLVTATLHDPSGGILILAKGRVSTVLNELTSAGWRHVNGNIYSKDPYPMLGSFTALSTPLYQAREVQGTQALELGVKVIIGLVSIDDSRHLYGFDLQVNGARLLPLLYGNLFRVYGLGWWASLSAASIGADEFLMRLQKKFPDVIEQGAFKE